MTEEAAGDFHVAIVGAGIGGLALAMALHKKSMSFTLYEAAAEYSTVGAGIGFAPNGLAAMDAIEPTFRPRYEAISIGNADASAQNVFFEGLLLEEGLGVDEPWYGDSSWGHEGFNRKSAHRKALLDIMTSYIPPHTVQFNKHLTGIQQNLSNVTLTFSDTTTTNATILIGADGIKSIVRKHVLHPFYPAQTDPVYANAYCYRGVIPIREAEDILGDLTHVAKFYFGVGRCGVTYRISGGEEFNFLLCVATPTTPWPLPNAVIQTVTHSAMMADFAGPGVDRRFHALLEKAKPIRWGLFHHLHTSTYHRGRVVIMGDAAHASLPFQAAGAAQGVEDAVVLAGVLEALAGKVKGSDHHNGNGNGNGIGTDNDNRNGGKDEGVEASITAAFEAYDAIRRPRAQKQVEQSAEMSRLIFFQGQDEGADLNRILPRLQRGRFEWLWFHDVRGDVERAVERMEGMGR